MYRLLYLFVLCLAVSLFGGKYVAEFTEIGISARACGMGGAFASTDGGVQSQFYNPAGIRAEIQGYLMHAMLYNNLFNVDAGVFSYPLGRFRTSLALARFATDHIPFTRADGFYDWGTDGIPGTNDPDGTEGNGVWDPGEPVRTDMVDYKSEGDYLVLLGSAYPISERLNAGINLKYLHHNIGGYTSNGWGIDLGSSYILNDNITLGAALRDAIGTRVKWSTDFVETKRPTLTFGGHYSYPLPMNKSDVKMAVNLESKFENATGMIEMGKVSIIPLLGLETNIFDILKLRCGYDTHEWSAGAGIEFFDFEIDYAFLSGELDNSHRIGVTFTYRQPKKIETIAPIEVIDTIAKTPEPEPEPEPVPEPVDEEQPPEKGAILGEIYFEVAKADIAPSSQADLSEALRILKIFDHVNIVIEGHTDRVPIDTEEFPNNQVLSEARAKAIYDFFISQGIPSSRMRTAGFSSNRAKFTGDEFYRNRRGTIMVE